MNQPIIQNSPGVRANNISNPGFNKELSRFTGKNSAIIPEYLDNIADLQNTFYKSFVQKGFINGISFVNALGNAVKIKPEKQSKNSDLTPLAYGAKTKPGFTNNLDLAIDTSIRQYNSQITQKKLCEIHSILFKNSGELKPHNIGTFRKVDVCVGEEFDDGSVKVTNSAPPASEINRLMAEWFAYANNTNNNVNPVIRAAIADFWLCRIQPFRDGNSRTACVVSDMMMARAENVPTRFYSIGKHLYEIKDDCSVYAWDESDDVEQWACFFLHNLRDSIAKVKI